MKRKGIKNLIFDFGGVLINLDRQRCIENFRKLGLEKVDELLGMYQKRSLKVLSEKFSKAVLKIRSLKILSANYILSYRMLKAKK